MATIVENITGDKAIQLGNEELVRKLGYGTNWTKLKIGCRLCVNGTANVTTPRFQMGLCVGDQFTFASSSCIQYVGTCTNETATMTYNGSDGFVYGESTNFPYVTKVGASASYSIIGGASNMYYPSGGSGRTGITYVILTKVSATSMSIEGCYLSATEYLLTPTTYDLLRIMDDEASTTAFTNNFVTQFGPRTISGMSNVVDLDTLSIYWSHSTPTVDVHDICVVRYY